MHSHESQPTWLCHVLQVHIYAALVLYKAGILLLVSPLKVDDPLPKDEMVRLGSP